MSFFWFTLSISLFGTVSLQYVTKDGPQEGSEVDYMNPARIDYPVPYVDNLHNDIETYQNVESNPLYQLAIEETQPAGLHRQRRTAAVETGNRQWMPNLLDVDKTLYFRNADLPGSPFVMQAYSGPVESNTSIINRMNILDSVDKKSFSPWGGKRDTQMPYIEHMWTWKRDSNLREPNMPKRVRFSPWGGKRSGQLIYKPGGKNSRIILSQTTPEFTRFISTYSPNEEKFNMAGFQFIPASDRRHPIRVLALSTRFDQKQTKERMPFNAFLEVLPKLFKPGHPYADVNLKKDGKRKVKFSAWGGKRSPPIIGPIWTPAPQDVKDTTLNAILLIRNQQKFNDQSSKHL